MATVNEKMTQLANAIRSKSGTTGALSLDGMISAVNGITTGSGTTTYQLWGSHSVKPDDINVGGLAGSYQMPQGCYTWFYDSFELHDWWFDEVDRIVVYANGDIDVFGKNCPAAKFYNAANDSWTDEDEYFVGNDRLLLYNFIDAANVEQNLYVLFREMYDNGYYNLDAYDIGYGVGYEDGAANGLPALGVLCDWSLMVDEGSSPVLTIINYHPFYSMECTVECTDATGELNTFDVVVDPNDSTTTELWGNTGLAAGALIDVYDVRWT